MDQNQNSQSQQEQAAEKNLDQIIEMYAEQSAPSAHEEAFSEEAPSTEKSMVERLLSSRTDEELFPEELFTNLAVTNLEFAEDEVIPVEIHDLSAIVETANQKMADDTSVIAHEDAQLIEEIKNIPDRMGFKIGDVAEIVDVKQYVLRYWETEFEVLKPKKSRQNQRMYTKKDIENVLLIKKLLYRDKFSIEGARLALKQLKSQVRETKHWDQVADRYEHAIEQLRGLVAEVHDFKSLFR